MVFIFKEERYIIREDNMIILVDEFINRPTNQLLKPFITPKVLTLRIFKENNIW